MAPPELDHNPINQNGIPAGHLSPYAEFLASPQHQLAPWQVLESPGKTLMAVLRTIAKIPDRAAERVHHASCSPPLGYEKTPEVLENSWSAIT